MSFASKSSHPLSWRTGLRFRYTASICFGALLLLAVPVERPMSALKPSAVFSMPGGAPDWMVLTGDAVWVSDSPKNSVYRLDPASNRISATITPGQKPCSGITAGAGFIWVPLCGDRALAAIDERSNQVAARLPFGPADSEGGIAFGDGSVWMLTDKKGVLSRIDPVKRSVVAQVEVPHGSFACAFGDGAVWATSTETDQLARVDPKTNRVTHAIKVGKGPRFLTAGAGSVWTLNQGDGTISRVDTRSAKLTASIAAGLAGTGGEIAFGEGAVWATLFKIPITRIDPATNSVTAQWKGPGGDSIRAGFGSLWLTKYEQHTLWRLNVPLE